MDPRSLARLVLSMRQAQASYFRTRDTDVLRASKAAEADVDRAVAGIIDGQTSFLGGEPDFGTVACNVSDVLDGHGWIAVDLDGTLAHYEGFKGPTVLGEPIPAMVAQVRRWLLEERKVCIYTARISGATDGRDPQEVKAAIKAWCLPYIGRELPVTCIKHWGIDAFYDDRCFRVEKNTGRIMEER